MPFQYVCWQRYKRNLLTSFSRNLTPISNGQLQEADKKVKPPFVHPSSDDDDVFRNSRSTLCSPVIIFFVITRLFFYFSLISELYNSFSEQFATERSKMLKACPDLQKTYHFYVVRRLHFYTKLVEGYVYVSYYLQTRSVVQS